MKINIVDKSKIDRTVRDVIRSGMNEFSAKYISRTTGIDIETVRHRLFYLRDDEQLIINFDMKCCNCFKNLETVHSEKEVPILEELFCPDCNESRVVKPENIMVSFTPNKEYYEMKKKK